MAPEIWVWHCQIHGGDLCPLLTSLVLLAMPPPHLPSHTLLPSSVWKSFPHLSGARYFEISWTLLPWTPETPAAVSSFPTAQWGHCPVMKLSHGVSPGRYPLFQGPSKLLICVWIPRLSTASSITLDAAHGWGEVRGSHI
jgi:hypothetical protein